MNSETVWQLNELPKQFLGDPETIREIGQSQGMSEEAIQANLLGMAEAIWNAEEGRAFGMLDEGRLDEPSHDALLERLWERHQQTWGEFAKRP